jgi:hypothetical protein
MYQIPPMFQEVGKYEQVPNTSDNYPNYGLILYNSSIVFVNDSQNCKSSAITYLSISSLILKYSFVNSSICASCKFRFLIDEFVSFELTSPMTIEKNEIRILVIRAQIATK